MTNNPLIAIRRRNFINHLLAHIKSNGKKAEFVAKIGSRKITVKLNKVNLENFLRDVFEEQDCRQHYKYSKNDIYQAYGTLYTANGRISESGKDFVEYITTHMPDYLNNRGFKHNEL